MQLCVQQLELFVQFWKLINKKTVSKFQRLLGHSCQKNIEVRISHYSIVLRKTLWFLEFLPFVKEAPIDIEARKAAEKKEGGKKGKDQKKK